MTCSEISYMDRTILMKVHCTKIRTQPNLNDCDAFAKFALECRFNLLTCTCSTPKCCCSFNYKSIESHNSLLFNITFGKCKNHSYYLFVAISCSHNKWCIFLTIIFDYFLKQKINWSWFIFKHSKVVAESVLWGTMTCQNIWTKKVWYAEWNLLKPIYLPDLELLQLHLYTTIRSAEYKD